MSAEDHERDTTPTPARLRARLLKGIREQRDYERERDLAVWKSLAISLLAVTTFYFLGAEERMSGLEFFFVFAVLFLILLAMTLLSVGPAPPP